MPHKILALKDRPEYAIALKQLIELHGYELITVSTTGAAVLVLQSQRVDMIVVAIHLEEGNVFEFIRTIRLDPDAKIACLPIICLNLDPQLHAPRMNEHLKNSAKSLGANQFITMEPFDPNVLWLEIEKFLPRLLAKSSD